MKKVGKKLLYYATVIRERSFQILHFVQNDRNEVGVGAHDDPCFDERPYNNHPDFIKPHLYVNPSEVKAVQGGGKSSTVSFIMFLSLFSKIKT